MVSSDEVEKSCSRAKTLNPCTQGLGKTTFAIRIEGGKLSITRQLQAVINSLIKEVYQFPVVINYKQ